MIERGLGRNPYQDPRSRAFGIVDIETREPRSYTWGTTFQLDQGPEPECVPPGTLIRLADGSHRAVENIKVLDSVVSAEGSARMVTQTMARWYDGELVSVKARGHHPVQTTPGHPFLTDRGYVPAGELQVGDRVAVTRFLPTKDADSIDINNVVNVKDVHGVIDGYVNTGGVISHVAPLPVVLAKTPALGRLLGLYAAEGDSSRNRVCWSYGADELDTLVAETVALIKSAFDAEARIQIRPNNSIVVVLYGQTWRRLFEALIPGTARHGTKRLSGQITSGPAPFLDALVDGWLDGDGHRRRTNVEGITVCHQLALDMHGIANGLGRIPTINVSNPSMNAHAATRQRRWNVSLPEAGGQNLQPHTRTAVWRKVMAVKREPYSGYVFNLHVQEDESYVAEGIGVHNCVGFSWAAELGAKPMVIPVSDSKGRLLYKDAQDIDRAEGRFWDAGASVLAGAKAVQRAGHMPEYRWAFGVQQFATGVSRVGPGVIGVDWHSGMMDVDSAGYIRPTGSLVGGHAILVRGYSVTKRRFLAHNSWGSSWGGKGGAPPGCCWISYDDLGELLSRMWADACIPLRRAK